MSTKGSPCPSTMYRILTPLESKYWSWALAPFEKSRIIKARHIADRVFMWKSFKRVILRIGGPTVHKFTGIWTDVVVCGAISGAVGAPSLIQVGQGRSK